jgi:hypothetical protein
MQPAPFAAPKKKVPIVSTRYIYGNWLYACNAESGDPLAAKYLHIFAK